MVKALTSLCGWEKASELYTSQISGKLIRCVAEAVSQEVGKWQQKIISIYFRIFAESYQFQCLCEQVCVDSTSHSKGMFCLPLIFLQLIYNICLKKHHNRLKNANSDVVFKYLMQPWFDRSKSNCLAPWLKSSVLLPVCLVDGEIITSTDRTTVV